MYFRSLFIWLITVLVTSVQLSGQISFGGLPQSFRLLSEFQANEFKLDPINLHKVFEEDIIFEKNGNPLRFAISTPVEIDLARDGQWNYSDDMAVCLLAIKSTDAQGLIFYYSRFNIPEGGKLYIYSHNRKKLIGAFTSETNPSKQFFATEMIASNEVLIEYNCPDKSDQKPEIFINEIGVVYRLSPENTDGFGGAGACEVNINCEEGINYQNAKRAIARIIVKQGASSYWCTGSLLNNTRQDFTPYMLTADHCGFTSTPQELQQWIFYFKYESDDCTNPPSDTAFDSYTMVGATKIAAAGKIGTDIRSDFKLLLLNESVPADYNPYFLGWSTASTGSSSGVSLHHPQGDIMKISTYQTPLISTAWATTPNTHWKVTWAETTNGHSVTEGGSSGCPILDAEGRVIGQLTGGEATCNSPVLSDYYGQFRFSWDQINLADTTKLKPWLDPDNTGLSYLNGGWLGLNRFPKPATSLVIEPNPASNYILLKNNKLVDQRMVIRVQSPSGFRILELPAVFSHQGEFRLDLPDFENGLYLITITDARTLLTGKVIIIK